MIQTSYGVGIVDPIHMEPGILICLGERFLVETTRFGPYGRDNACQKQYDGDDILHFRSDC